METYRFILIAVFIAISTMLYSKWIAFSAPAIVPVTESATDLSEAVTDPSLPSAPAVVANAEGSLPQLTDVASENPPPVMVDADQVTSLIVVETDKLIAKINPLGGVLERVEAKDHPVDIEAPELGYPVLRNTSEETLIIQDGLLRPQSKPAPNHTTQYAASRDLYMLTGESIRVPLVWKAENGVTVVKTFTFRRDSYVVDIDYEVINESDEAWTAYQYTQFNRSEPVGGGGGFGQIPSYTGGVIYTDAEKYEKVSLSDIDSKRLSRDETGGWVAMLEHYFVTAWLPTEERSRFFSRKAGDRYILGAQSLRATEIQSGAHGILSTRVFLGPKEQSRLRAAEEKYGATGFPLAVDYGMLTFIADPLFWLLEKINDVVKNWGWSIILLTLLIKLAFYPLSAASYKSMAGMKKIQPRLQTLKERYKDDRQKFQMEMMALYKQEKINPAGGCLPILIQIPVFIALYWVLLESVEIRQAPFALWLNDLSAPDPYYILPILMGVSMWVQQKLNPAPMEDIQKKVMMIMPFALTFLFMGFPSGLVLYWVVNNILSIAQQWHINRRFAE